LGDCRNITSRAIYGNLFVDRGSIVMDTFLITQLVVNLLGVYAAFIMAKVTWQAIKGQWTGMSKENAFLAFLIACLIGGMFTTGAVSNLTEMF
jgi:hypothetical protein